MMTESWARQLCRTSSEGAYALSLGQVGSSHAVCDDIALSTALSMIRQALCRFLVCNDPVSLAASVERSEQRDYSCLQEQQVLEILWNP